MYLNYFSYSWIGNEKVIEEVSGQFLKTIDSYFNLSRKYHKSVLYKARNGSYFGNENCQFFRIKNEQDFIFLHIVNRELGRSQEFENGELSAMWEGKSQLHVFSDHEEKGLVEQLKAVTNERK